MEKFYNVVVKLGGAMRLTYVKLDYSFTFSHGTRFTNYVYDIALGIKRKDISFLPHSYLVALGIFFKTYPFSFDDSLEIFVVDDDNNKIVYESKIELKRI